jgi:hypothetical protein
MSLETHAASHLDHNLTPEHVAWLLARFADREAFFIETVTLPDTLGEVDCGLYGPLCGDEPVPEDQVTYAIRGARKCASRVVVRPSRKTRVLTVIAGPHDGKACILFTAYGGPSAPREPGDLGLTSWEQVTEARAFWVDHALAKE